MRAANRACPVFRPLRQRGDDMNPDDMMIAALGLLLTEVRVSRRALEEVERASSRYMGVEFAKAFTAGANFGAPPMYQGALRVHVININDLSPGNTIADLLIGLLGGLGSLVGGLIGGAIGGTLAAYQLPKMIEDLRKIAADFVTILDKLDINLKNRPKTDDAKPITQASSGESIIDSLGGIQGMVKGLTALFLAGQGGPANANKAGQIAPEVLSEAGERWMAIVAGVNRLLERLTHLVDGLIILIPQLVGAIALLITRLPDIRRELLLTFQFILRNILVLRGVILTTLFDMMASAARLVASVVAVIGTTLEGILSSIVTVISAILSNAFAALTVLTDALTTVVGTLLKWLVEGVFAALRDIGNLSIFRTIDHLIRILPGLIEPIFMITVAATAGASERLPDDLSQRLTKAFDAGFAAPAPGAAGAGTPSAADIIGKFPDVAGLLPPLQATLSAAVAASGATIRSQATEAFDLVKGSVNALAGKFDAALVRETDLSRKTLADRRGTITANADRLATAITKPIDATGAATGLEDIAAAYETWLTSKGTLDTILAQAVKHIAQAPQTADSTGPMDLMRGQFDRPRASIEIERVEIIIEPPPTPPAPPPRPIGDFPRSDEDVWMAFHRHSLELEERGFRITDPYSMVS